MASRSSETAPRPAASEYAPHRACPSSAAARSWHESAPHRPPTARDPTRSTNPPASDSCRWLPCRSAPAPLLAGRTVLRRPRPAPASARQFLLSPYPTNSLAASWDENHILYSSCAKTPFCPAVLVLTKSILSSNRAFALIQSILSRFLRKVGRVVGHIMIGTVWLRMTHR